MRERALAWLLLAAVMIAVGWVAKSPDGTARSSPSTQGTAAIATAAPSQAASAMPSVPPTALPTSQLQDPGPSPCWSPAMFLPRLVAGEDPASVVQAIAAYHRSPATTLLAWRWLTADDHRQRYDFDATAETDADKVAAVVAWHEALVATQLNRPVTVGNTQCLAGGGVTYWRSEVLQPGEWVLVTQTGKVVRRVSCGNFLWEIPTTAPLVVATSKPPSEPMATEPSDEPSDEPDDEPDDRPAPAATPIVPAAPTATPPSVPPDNPAPTSMPPTATPTATATPNVTPTETATATEEPR